MDTIKIEASDDTPKVLCTSEGLISISGRSLTEDPFSFYIPILKWVENINAENLQIELRLDYVNTSSSKQIFNLLEVAKDNKWKKQLLIKWIYNENDDDGLSFGRELESTLDIPFEYQSYFEE